MPTNFIPKLIDFPLFALQKGNIFVQGYKYCSQGSLNKCLTQEVRENSRNLEHLSSEPLHYSVC